MAGLVQIAVQSTAVSVTSSTTRTTIVATVASSSVPVRVRRVLGLSIHNDDSITHKGAIETFDGTTNTEIGRFELLTKERFTFGHEDPVTTLAVGESLRVLLDEDTVTTAVKVTPEIEDIKL